MLVYRRVTVGVQMAFLPSCLLAFLPSRQGATALSRVAVGAICGLTGLLAATPAQAACEPWSAGVSVVPKVGRESRGFTVTWTGSSPAACTNGGVDDWDGTNHLELRRIAGAAAPSNPDAGSAVAGT